MFGTYEAAWWLAIALSAATTQFTGVSTTGQKAGHPRRGLSRIAGDAIPGQCLDLQRIDRHSTPNVTGITKHLLVPQPTVLDLNSIDVTVAAGGS